LPSWSARAQPKPRLDWHSRFDATLSARLVQPYLAWFVRDAAKRLLRAAEIR
jgi:hypothetical protein